jgi:hypothetical protein
MTLLSAPSPKKHLFFAVLLIASIVFAYPQPMQSQVKAPQSNTPASAQRGFLSQYCFGCHNEKTKTAGLMLDTMDIAHVGENAETWEKVVRKLRAGMMPPAGAQRPDRPTADGFTTWLENELDRSALAKPDFGSPGIHRLNRAEYANVIRDLLALEVGRQRAAAAR